MKKNKTNLYAHNTLLHELLDMNILLEVVVLCASALHLTKGGAMNKLPNHVKFTPVNLVGVIRVSFSVTLVSSNEIRHVHFPSDHS
jgi:hypothetical protein